jgi:hypothetical protein
MRWEKYSDFPEGHGRASESFHYRAWNVLKKMNLDMIFF